MRLTAQEFLDQEYKRITLIGMSGAGKSYLSAVLAGDGWFNYACDELIGSEYLGVDGGMSDLAGFVGQIGDPAHGGVGLDEFNAKQELYYNAECDVLRDLGAGIAAAGDVNFVNDSSGSLCEVEDESILDAVGRDTLFVYLKIDDADHGELLGRAISHPKPLYFSPAFFKEYLVRYMQESGVSTPEGLIPQVFLSWVFPHLFRSRLPKYERLADEYGVSVLARDVKDVKSADEFINVVAAALREQVR